MADYRLSIDAVEDIRTAYRSSLMMFGPRQTEAYMEGLRRTFRNLAQIPGMGRSAEHLKSRFFSFRYQSHMIFYTVESQWIVIQRVLHARMDFGSRL